MDVLAHAIHREDEIATIARAERSYLLPCACQLLINSNPVLEAFGNSKTIRNDLRHNRGKSSA